jgi:WD40 repeat protein/serine/threonine protein kinase
MAEADDLLDERLADLLAAYDEDLARGGLPPIATNEVPAELDARWRENAECLRLLDQLRPRPGDFPVPLPADVPNGADADGEGRYELFRLHASGGIGRVWLARDADLDRDVALKELLPERAGDPGMTARFLREARITGRLQHPGIVPVYEMALGRDGEPPFYTMRLIHGQTLTEAVRAYHARRTAGYGLRADRLGLIRLLNAFISVCHTVAYAHVQGVVHRDLKGENVVLGDFGEVIVLDWGFAKLLDKDRAGEVGETAAANNFFVNLSAADSRHTQAGQVLGTPAYMAPEQAEGRLDQIDARTDVFGLGAILYEILTGQPPFVGQDTVEVLRKARTGEMPRPQAVATDTPAALDAICARAMARRPEDRYPTATAVAQEVQHWLADEPIEAYREPILGRLSRKTRRHRAALAVLLAIVVTGSLAGGLGLALVGEARSRLTRAQAQAETDKAEGRAAADAEIKRRLESQLYFERVARAERELAANNLERADALLAACPEWLRGWEWRYLRRSLTAEPQVLRGHKAAVSAVVYSPDGNSLASASHDGTLKIWNAATGEEQFSIAGHADVAYDAAFSPDGSLLASAGWDGVVKLWDVATRKEVRSLRGHEGPVSRLAFAPHGRLLASLGTGQHILIWDVVEGTLLKKVETPSGQSIYRIVFSPGGERLAVTSSQAISFWETSRWSPQRQLDMPNRYVKCLAFSPDRRLLATGEGDLAYGNPGRVRLWDLETGELLATLEGHTEPIFGLVFSPDGSRLFSASQDKTVKIWDVASCQEALSLRGHTDTVRGLSLSPDGHRLATAGADGDVRLWDATPGETNRSPYELLNLTGHKEAVFALAYSPDGRRLASVSHSAGVSIWDAATGRNLAQNQQLEATNSFTLTFSPDGQSLAVAENSGKIHLMDVRTGQMGRFFETHSYGPIRSVAFSPDGQRLACASWDRSVRVWTLDSGAELVLRGHAEAVLGVAFSPKDGLLASASYDNTVRIWNGRTGELVQTLIGHTSRVQGVAFSRSGKRLASAGNDDTVRVWDAATWELIATLRGHTAGVSGVAFSSDDRFVASASHDRTVKVWDLDNGKTVRTFRGHTDRVHAVAFSPDGTRVASASHDRTVKVWKFTPPLGR